MDNDLTVVGKCPLCNGDVVKVQKGYCCVNSLGTEPSCHFSAGNLIGNRHMSDSEISFLLSEKRILLDGFSTKEQKVFSTVLTIEQDGSIAMKSAVGKCPKCGGDLYVNNRAFGCGNFRRPGDPCNFTIWRNIGGHEMTLKEVDEICTQGATANEITFYDNNGHKSSHRLGLNGDKDIARL